MDLLLEIIIDLVLEGSVEASKSKKIPKFLRYLLIFLISLFFIAVIGLILFMGITILKNSIIGGIIIILFALFMFVMSILKFKNMYLNKKIK